MREPLIWCYMMSYIINNVLLPQVLQKKDYIYLTQLKSIHQWLPIWTSTEPNYNPRRHLLDPSLCPESLPVTLHTHLELRHLIPKLTQCSGQIVTLWIFSGVWKQWKQALRAVSKPLNWSCFLWLDIFFEHQIPMVRFYVIQSLILDQLLIHYQPIVRRYTPSLNIVSRRLRLKINLALFYFLEKFMVKIIFLERDL